MNFFKPSFNKQQQKCYTLLGKLLRSEWLETQTIRGKDHEVVDVSDDDLLLDDKLVFHISKDYVFDEDNKKYSLEYFFTNTDKDQLESRLDCFCFDDEPDIPMYEVRNEMNKYVKKALN